MSRSAEPAAVAAARWPVVFATDLLDQLVFAPREVLPDGPSQLPVPSRVQTGVGPPLLLRTAPAGGYPARQRARPNRPHLSWSSDSLGALSLLLGWGHGLSRVELTGTASRPEHGYVASARGLCPTQLYCLFPTTGDEPGQQGEQAHPRSGAESAEALPPGLHYFDALHHSLLPLRAGEWVADASTVVGHDLGGACAVLLVTARLALTAHRYGDYAYRLAAQEAGMVIENLQLVADQLGLHQARYLSLDGPAASALLGPARDAQTPLCLLALYEHQTQARPLPVPPLDTTPPAGERSPGARAGEDPDHRVLSARLRRVDDAGRRASTAAPRNPVPTVRQDDTGRAVVPLTRCLRRRRSGHAVFNTVPVPLAARTLERVLVAALARRRVAAEPRTAGSGGPGTTVVRCHAVLNAVAGMPAGHYLARPQGLLELRRQDLTDRLQESQTAPGALSVNYHSVNLTLFVTGDARGQGERGGAGAVEGAWWFRRLSLDTGALAQRLSVFAAGAGLVARVHNGYDATAVQELLSLPEGEVPLFQLLIGTPRPDGVPSADLTYLPAW